MTIQISREQRLLDTGGGIRRVASFLAESDPCLVLGGDMLLDVDLTELVERHRESQNSVTFLLREDPRVDRFGSVGVDAESRVCRIGSRFPLESGAAGAEARAGVYTWANVISRRALATLPDREVFSHFDGWLAPLLAAGAQDIRGEFLPPCVWDPVGTL